MYQLNHVDATAFPKPAWLTSLGQYNDMPEPWKEIPVGQYYYLAAHYSPEFQDHRQIVLPGSKYMRSVRIYWFPHYGLAIAYPSEWASIDGTLQYTEDARYYYIGCEHDWREGSSNEMFTHNYTCTKCGAKQTTDSSG